jgi:hypothetical protein
MILKITHSMPFAHIVARQVLTDHYVISDVTLHPSTLDLAELMERLATEGVTIDTDGFLIHYSNRREEKGTPRLHIPGRKILQIEAQQPPEGDEE